METASPLHQAIIRRRGTPLPLPAEGSNPVVSQAEESEDKAFSFGRVGMRPQMTLLLRFANGTGRGFPYAQLLGLEYEDEEAGFRLEFPGTVVEVRGRNLTRLLRYVCDHRAARIDESPPQGSLAATDAAEIVDSIAVRKNVMKSRA